LQIFQNPRAPISTDGCSTRRCRRFPSSGSVRTHGIGTDSWVASDMCLAPHLRHPDSRRWENPLARNSRIWERSRATGLTRPGRAAHLMDADALRRWRSDRQLAIEAGHVCRVLERRGAGSEERIEYPRQLAAAD